MVYSAHMQKRQVSLKLAPKGKAGRVPQLERGSPEHRPIFYIVHIPAGLTSFPHVTGMVTVAQAGGCPTAEKPPAGP